MTRDSVKPSDDRLARKGSLDQKRIDNAERGGDTLDAMYRVALWYKSWYERRSTTTGAIRARRIRFSPLERERVVVIDVARKIAGN